LGATAYDWYAQKTWQDPRALWNKIDPVPFLSQNGFNWLRAGVTMISTPQLESGPPSPLVWKDEYWCSREYTLNVLKAGAKAGMHLDLFFYLTDKAAYGGNQKAPAGWEEFTLEETEIALKQYTYETTKYYKDNGLKIELYEIGNEIEFGICGYSADTKLSLPGVDILREYASVRQEIWVKEAVLLKAAIEGVKKADPDAKIVLHVSISQYPELTKAFFQAMNDFGVVYDYAGLSYYPWLDWHPEIKILSNCLDLSIDAIAKMDKEVIISEFSFPSKDEPLLPVVGLAGYPFSDEGQAKWIWDFLLELENNPNIKAGFYFYPDNYLVEDVGACALFSDDKNPKPALYEFKKFQSETDDSTPPK
jgi:arabinogalactan endo-1,4-beta-galactosidase